MRDELADLLAWHRRNELPHLTRLLGRAQAMAPLDLQPNDACALVEEIEARLLAVARQAEPAAAEIALSLDPFQLWAITAHNAVGHEDFTKPKSGQRWDRQAILDALERHGFFERWRDFKAQQQANADH